MCVWGVGWGRGLPSLAEAKVGSRSGCEDRFCSVESWEFPEEVRLTTLCGRLRYDYGRERHGWST